MCPISIGTVSAPESTRLPNSPLVYSSMAEFGPFEFQGNQSDSKCTDQLVVNECFLLCKASGETLALLA